MPKAIDLLRQGRTEELWQMCCGFLNMSIGEFMDIQQSLLLEQMKLFSSCPLGKKIMHGMKPETVEEFRKQVPLTTYADYCPELEEKREDVLPVKPEIWVHSSGRSEQYPFKWVPMTPTYSQQLSEILYGIGMLSCCKGWGDSSRFPLNTTKILYSVAPSPYISGAFAEILSTQSPIDYLPPIEEVANIPFEERIRLGFKQAMTEGLDYFFGVSLVLVTVGEKFKQSSEGIDIRPFLTKPKALWRLVKGMTKSRLAGRSILPKDLWLVKGIIGSGLDSWIYKDKVKELWGRPPLDIYSSTEGGVMATQTWDYSSLTFIPNLNFFEFIPEDEHYKWQMDRSYQPETLLLDEVKAGENYELVLTNFHGGALVRYRIGDMVRITSLRNEKLGIEIPQMAFERRTDDLLDFIVVKLTEKKIWQAIEETGIAYEDWTAYKEPGQPVLQLLIEPKDGTQINETEMAVAVQEQIINSGKSSYETSGAIEDWREAADFRVEIGLLPNGTFASYTAQRQAEGADPAQLKPPHINASAETLSRLLAKTEEVIVVTKAETKVKSETEGESETEELTV